MAAVISDTSPIQALRYLQLLDLLPDFFSQVLVPPTVAAELSAVESGLPPFDVRTTHWIVIRAPTDERLVRSFSSSLGRGESEAIALALETRADALLIDERKGRAHALRAGLKVAGTIGLLLRAKRLHRIHEIAPLLKSLESGISFRVSRTLREQVLREAGEPPNDAA